MCADPGAPFLDDASFRKANHFPSSEGATLNKISLRLLLSGIVYHLEELPEYPLNVLTVNSGECQ